MKNIIILTSGLSGSSVVTNLLSEAGYWKGDVTCKKSDYNTHENSRLVELNSLLLNHVNYENEYSHFVKPEKLLEVEQLYHQIDIKPFEQFINDCEQSASWIWKDPRLWVTMPFWLNLLEEGSFQIVFVDRKNSQRWISELLRKNIQTFSYCKNYNNQIKKLIKQLINNHNLSYCNVLFDDLIESPAATIDVMNSCIGCLLSVDDLKTVYNKPLYKKIRGMKSLFLALLIYLKNYHLRLK